MNQHTLISLLIGMIFLFTGCQSSLMDDTKQDENKQLEKESIVDIYDFAFIKKAPETTERQSLQDVIKVYFNENDSALNFGYAIDLKEKAVYTDSLMGVRGLQVTTEEPIQLDDVDELIDILEKYDVENWAKAYTTENPESYEDGYGWQLWLQYEDGSVLKAGGQGTNQAQITPDNFNAFVKEIRNVIEDR